MFNHLETEKKENNGELANDVDCSTDPIGSLKKMFVDMVMGARISRGQDPVMRPVFLKPHGVARGLFKMRPDLPEELRIGLFGLEKFEAWVRFSSDTVPSLPDIKTTLGIGIKLFQVPGKKLLEPETDALTHDLILQNHDVFFVDTAKDMCEFTRAGVVLGDYDSYLDAHPVTKEILSDMQKVVPSLLTTDFWSVLPYAFGEGRYVKYKLVPYETSENGDQKEIESSSYLYHDLKERLIRGEAGFKFMVQFQTDEQTMPLDQATVRWDEELSEPVHVADLVLYQQDIDARGQSEYGENLSYNPWHALAQHQPVGSISEARKAVYEAAAEVRRNLNGVPLGEPAEARPLKNSDALPKDTKIVRAAIHPSIGIARVGNSEDFFIGPEVVTPQPQEAGFYKDKQGALKRQAAKFRVYGYNAAGEVVGELTANNADIEWTVHVANLKAVWYEFQLAMDVPEASDPSLDPSNLRNADVKGKNRQKLIIDPGPRSICGTGKSGAQYKFDTGEFFGKSVYLGELQTDEFGHLLFLGGRGVSASYKGPNEKPTTFANNDGWHDDTSDGPVTAAVSIKGKAIPVAPAWVVTAPPNYAPDIIGVRTMYDLMSDIFIQDGRLTFPSKISFTKHVYPILYRLCNLQWVNQGFALQYGVSRPHDFLNPEFIAALAAKDTEGESAFSEMKRQISNTFRDFGRDGMSPVPWPWLYGDAMNIPPANTPRQHVEITETQRKILQLWVEGKFESDWDPYANPPQTLDQVKISDQPEMLDRASLEFCLADAFHPGCEMTWPMRHSSMYMLPFRIRHRTPEDQPERIYGRQLTPQNVLLEDGVLYGQNPGTITRWMAVPWQTDTASCRSGYEFILGMGPLYDPYIPTFWPARVPNHVLTESDYETAINPDKPRDERIAAFNRRSTWLRVLSQNYMDAINEFIHDFGKMGVVETRDGVKDDPDLPEVMLVESRPEFKGVELIASNRNLIALHVSEAESEGQDADLTLVTEIAERPEEEFMTGYIEKVRRFKRIN